MAHTEFRDGTDVNTWPDLARRLARAAYGPRPGSRWRPAAIAYSGVAASAANQKGGGFLLMRISLRPLLLDAVRPRHLRPVRTENLPASNSARGRPTQAANNGGEPWKRPNFKFPFERLENFWTSRGFTPAETRILWKVSLERWPPLLLI